MDAKELQSIKDAEYAKSLGYDTKVLEDEQTKFEFEMTNLFDYKGKTKEYFEAMV